MFGIPIDSLLVELYVDADSPEVSSNERARGRAAETELIGFYQKDRMIRSVDF